MIARYLYADGYKTHEITERLEDYIIMTYDTASIPKWHDLIDKCSRSAYKYRLTEIESVPITKAELDTIAEIKSKPLRRLAFTLLCVSKFYNMTRPNNNDWTNIEDRDLFTLSNIQASITRQSLMLNDLYALGLIGFSKLVDNVNINVKFIDRDGDPVLHISDFRNLGYQYLKYCNEDEYIECESCGLVIKRSGRRRYCPCCAADNNRSKAAERWRLTHPQ